MTATTDQSLATLCEDWIVRQLRTITYGSGGSPPKVFEDAEVAPWEGNYEEAASLVATALQSARRDVIAQVRFAGDQAVESPTPQRDITAMYDIWLGLKNYRPGTSRIGDGTVPGTNWMRAAIQDVLDNVHPTAMSEISIVAISVTHMGRKRATELCRYVSCETVTATNTQTILLLRVEIPEVTIT